jgi:hypothetical protein
MIQYKKEIVIGKYDKNKIFQIFNKKTAMKFDSFEEFLLIIKILEEKYPDLRWQSGHNLSEIYKERESLSIGLRVLTLNTVGCLCFTIRSEHCKIIDIKQCLDKSLVIECLSFNETI